MSASRLPLPLASSTPLADAWTHFWGEGDPLFNAEQVKIFRAMFIAGADYTLSLQLAMRRHPGATAEDWLGMIRRMQQEIADMKTVVKATVQGEP